MKAKGNTKARGGTIMRIGNLELRHGLMLAPMAGFTDRAMRLVCREWGVEYSVTEMISAKAVVFGDKKTLTLAKIGEDEGDVALQLFGSEPDVMAKAVEVMQNLVEFTHLNHLSYFMHNILSYQNRKYKTKIAFYTNNKEYISCVDGHGTNTSTFTTPLNTKYILYYLYKNIFLN